MKFGDWKPKIICLCGSTRFMKEFQEENLRLTMAGVIVLTVGCATRSDEDLGLSAEDERRLDKLHLKKIAMADEILVLNVKGYVGESTAREIAYARIMSKPVGWLQFLKGCSKCGVEKALLDDKSARRIELAKKSLVALVTEEMESSL